MICYIFNPLNTEFRSEKTHFLSNVSFLDRFSTSTVISMEMAKNEIFSYCLFCFWNGNCWLCWEMVCLLDISESGFEAPEPQFSYFDTLGKWFAPLCEGATFAWRFTTTKVSCTWNLFLLDERKSNRGVQMCRRSSQLKIRLIFKARKGHYTNQCLLKRLQANFNSQFVYASLTMLRNLVSWSVTLGIVGYITNILLLNNQSRDLFFPRRAKSRCRR